MFCPLAAADGTGPRGSPGADQHRGQRPAQLCASHAGRVSVSSPLILLLEEFDLFLMLIIEDILLFT